MSSSKLKSKASEASEAKQKPVEELSYEQAFVELESIVSSLESDQLALEEAMSLYERGQALTKYCVELLDKAELRLKQLSGDTLIDFPPEA
jgi:exodeoxyribonuclease VII small subunit